MRTQRTWGSVGRPRDTRESEPFFCIRLARRRTLKMLAVVLAANLFGPFFQCPAHSYNSQPYTEPASDSAFFKTAADRLPFLLTDRPRDCFQSFWGSGRGSFAYLTFQALHTPKPLFASDSLKAALIGNRALAFMFCGTFSPRSPPSGNSC